MRIGADLGPTRSDTLPRLRDALRRFDLTRFETEDCGPACLALADMLRDVAAGSAILSEELHSRYFTHTSPDARRH